MEKDALQEPIASLLPRIVANTDGRVDGALPSVTMLTAYHRCRSYGVEDKAPSGGLKPRGYHSQRLTVCLLTAFDPVNSLQLSKFLHEPIHLVPWRRGRGEDDCQGQLELEA